MKLSISSRRNCCSEQASSGPSEAELITELIRRDLPYYDAAISPEFVAGMNRFARDLGILSGDVPYEKVVAMAA